MKESTDEQHYAELDVQMDKVCSEFIFSFPCMQQTMLEQIYN